MIQIQVVLKRKELLMYIRLKFQLMKLTAMYEDNCWLGCVLQVNQDDKTITEGVGTIKV